MRKETWSAVGRLLEASRNQEDVGLKMSLARHALRLAERVRVVAATRPFRVA